MAHTGSIEKPVSVRQTFSKARLIIVLCVGLLLAAGCQDGPPPGFPSRDDPKPMAPKTLAEGEQRTLVIAATGDLKGWITSTTLYPNRKPHGLAHLALLIHALRARHPELILLDGGDAFVGAPNTALWRDASSGSMEQGNSPGSGTPTMLPMMGLMNLLRYDAMVLGNMDIALGWGPLLGLTRQARFPVLAGNLLRGEQPVLPAYHLLERQGLRVAVVGLTTPRAVIGRDPARLDGARFLPLEDTARRWARWLREKHGADVVIGLFHAGLDDDFGRKEALRIDATLFTGAGRVADEDSGFDLLISADAHRLSPKRRSGASWDYAVPVVEPGAYGKALVVVRMVVQAKAGRWRVGEVRREAGFARKEPDKGTLLGTGEALRRTRQWLAEPTRVFFHRRPTKKAFYQCAGMLNHLALSGALSKEGGPRFNSKPDKAMARPKAREAGHPKANETLRLPSTSPGLETEAQPLLSLLPLWRWPGKGQAARMGKKERGQPLRRMHLLRWLPYRDEWVLTSITGRQVQLLLEPYVRHVRKWRIHPNLVLWPGGMALQLPAKGSEITSLSGILENGKQLPLSPNAWYGVWMTRYIRHGGGGLAPKSLLIRDNTPTRPPMAISPPHDSLREAVFSLLSKDRPPLPAPCGKWLRLSS